VWDSRPISQLKKRGDVGWDWKKAAKNKHCDWDFRKERVMLNRLGEGGGGRRKRKESQDVEIIKEQVEETFEPCSPPRGIGKINLTGVLGMLHRTRKG